MSVVDSDNMSFGSSNSSVTSVPRFMGTTEVWPLWKAKFIGYLVGHDLLCVIQSSDEDVISQGVQSLSTPVTAGKKKKKKNVIDTENGAELLEQKSNRVYGALMLALGGEALQMVLNVEIGDARAIWKILCDRYERNTMANTIHLRRMLHSSKMKESEAFDIFLARVNHIVMRLKQMGSDVNEEEKLFVVLDGLPDSYESLKQSLEVNEKGMVETCQHIRDYQEKVKSKEKADVEVYAAHGRYNHENGQSSTTFRSGHYRSARVRTCFSCGKEGHIQYDCELNQNVKKCNLCRKLGHVREQCQWLENNQRTNSTSTSTVLSAVVADMHVANQLQQLQVYEEEDWFA